ncbi:MAG: metallophosphoesterase [Acidimicrobiales bacterium]
MTRRRSGDVWVFAVEDAAAQVCWRSLPEGTVIRAGDAAAVVGADRRPGAAVLDGLAPGRRLEVTLTRPGRPEAVAATFKTLTPPPGEELCRFATVNDVHIGEAHFGLLGSIREPGRRPPGSGLGYSARCLAAALAEAQYWGAQALVAKGDLTCHGRAPEWSEVSELLGGVGVPVLAVVGNHDVQRRAIDGRPALAARGIVVPDHPFHIDLPGIRLVMAHSAVRGHSHGRVQEAQRAAVAELTADAGGPVFVGLHHYFHRLSVRLSYPPAIPGGEAGALFDALAAANPATLISSGHSHRNRRRTRGPLVVTQIGATMHYPGVWAGYVVHEGGIRQVVRRVAEPSAIAWTERTGHALLGAWRPWAAGLRSHRCFSHPWPPVRRK